VNWWQITLTVAGGWLALSVVFGCLIGRRLRAAGRSTTSRPRTGQRADRPAQRPRATSAR
jgi:hypothetical protein